jgi:starch phosphorylase
VRVGHAFRESEHWTRTSILNAARMGRFSSDRAVREYAGEIWHVEPVPIGPTTALGMGALCDEAAAAG